MSTDLTNLAASIGYDINEGILNDFESIDKQELTSIDNVVTVPSFEEGSLRVLHFCAVYCKASPDTVKELETLLNGLKDRAANSNVEWIVWGVQRDVSLGYIQR